MASEVHRAAAQIHLNAVTSWSAGDHGRLDAENVRGAVVRD